MGIRLVEIETGGNFLVLQGHHDFNHSGNSGGRFEMPDIGFYRTDEQWFFRLVRFSENSIQGTNFDGISKSGAGTVGFDILDGFRL